MLTKLDRTTMIHDLLNDVRKNPQNWDIGFYEKIPSLTDEWLKANHSDIGFVWTPSYDDKTIDLNKAFA